MRVSDAIPRCVVFIGYSGGDDSFQAVGTGFFINHKRRRYLLTAQHIAAALGDDPFAIRVNKNDGTSDNLMVDLLKGTTRWSWISNAHDPDVDLAVLPFPIDLAGTGYNCLIDLAWVVLG